MVWINLFSIWIVINFTTTYRMMMIHFVTFYFQPQGSNVTIMMYGITGLNPNNNKYAVLIFLCMYVHRTFEHKKPNVILWKSLYKRKEVFFIAWFLQKASCILRPPQRRFTTESSFNRSNDREIMSICLWSLIGQYSWVWMLSMHNFWIINSDC